jgi:HEAT repeat protein
MIKLAAAMADDESVRSGTRYDALRILGADEYDRSGEQLKKYLTDDDAELQMGAIGGLSDMESPAAAEAILSFFSKYNDENRKLAIDAMLRSDARRAMLKRAVDSGQVPPSALTAEHADQ